MQNKSIKQFLDEAIPQQPRHFISLFSFVLKYNLRRLLKPPYVTEFKAHVAS